MKSTIIGQGAHFNPVSGGGQVSHKTNFFTGTPKANDNITNTTKVKRILLKFDFKNSFQSMILSFRFQLFKYSHKQGREYIPINQCINNTNKLNITTCCCAD